MRKLIVIAHNIRSCHNIGSLLRTAEGLGVEMVYLTGYTPYPLKHGDPRLPHIAKRLDEQIRKTALGAEKQVRWESVADIYNLMQRLRSQGYRIVALEQTATSIKLPDYQPPDKLSIIIGRELEGVESDVLAMTDEAISIPMFGQKESFNVIQATAMALYHCRFKIFIP